MSRITGTDARSLMEAYNAVYTPQINEEQVWEEVEIWVNSLVEEGYDLSGYTWEEMYESYLSEVANTQTPQQRAEFQKKVDAANKRGLQGLQKIGGDAVNVAGAAATGALGSAVSKKIGNEVKYIKKTAYGSDKTPTPTAKVAPTPAAKPQFGTTTPRGSSVTSTGVSGLSAADRAAYSAGGGNAAAQKGMGRTSAQVIAQGKTNLGRMDQGKPAAARPAAPAPAAARPTAPAAARPTAPAATPAARVTPAAAAPSTAATGFKLAQQGVNLAAPKKPSLASGIDDLKKMGDASRQRQASMLNQSFDPFDYILEHLVAEGFADTNEASLAIMANMSEDWRNQILEEFEQLNEISDKLVVAARNKLAKRTDRSVSALSRRDSYSQDINRETRMNDKIQARNKRTGSNVEPTFTRRHQ